MWWIFAPQILMCAAIMLRRLLACLALLTGLTAAGAPVHAQVIAEVAAQADAGLAETAARTRVPPLVARGVASIAIPAFEPAVRSYDQVDVCLSPPVRTGIDRARE